MGKDNKLEQNHSWVPLNISALEADLAFFEAKLAMLGEEPGSYYKDAQLRVYRELSVAIQAHVVRLKGQARKKKPDKQSSKASERNLSGEGATEE